MKTFVYLAISFCILMTVGFAIGFIFDVLKATWHTAKNKPYTWKTFEIFTKCQDWKIILLLGTIICIGVYGCSVASIDIVRSEYETEDEFCNLCGTYSLSDEDLSKCYHNYVCCDYCGIVIPEEFVYITTDRDPELFAENAALKASVNASLNGKAMSQGDVNKIYDEAYQEAYNYALNNTICHRCVYQDYREILDEISERPYAFSEDVFYVEKAECVWCGNLAPENLCISNGDPICVDCISEALQDSSLSHALKIYSEDK